MNIIKRVQVKQIITEKSKQKIEQDFSQQKMYLEQECQQLLFEQRKLQNKPGLSKQEIKDRFEQEIEQRKEKIRLLDFKIEQLAMLELGSELVEREVDALVEVKEGSSWSGLMDEQAIVIKDDVVIRIDE